MRAVRRQNRTRWRLKWLLALQIGVGAAGANGCYSIDPAPNPSGYNNTYDFANRNAGYVGSASCTTCHSEIAAQQALHNHAHLLSPVDGNAPAFPASAPNAGVPNPPAGFNWSDISYVIGGYAKRALFLDQDGYLLTSAGTGENTQWQLPFPANGAIGAFVPFLSDGSAVTPFKFDEIRRLSTGATPLGPRVHPQDGRAGIEGAWAEPGIQCEACHGPGGNHQQGGSTDSPLAVDVIFVDPPGTQTCVPCHSEPFGDKSGVIAAADGFIVPNSEAAQLKASGGHAKFQCIYCHDPHRSALFDSENAILNDCVVCHAEQSMAGHRGKVFQRGSYREVLTCKSCHMPFATRSGSTGTPVDVGPEGRMGDSRSHIFRINTDLVDFTTFFSEDGREVRRDAKGRAAVTVDFVCLRCHGGTGVFQMVVESAATIAQQLHTLP